MPKSTEQAPAAAASQRPPGCCRAEETNCRTISPCAARPAPSWTRKIPSAAYETPLQAKPRRAASPTGSPPRCSRSALRQQHPEPGRVDLDLGRRLADLVGIRIDGDLRIGLDPHAAQPEAGLGPAQERRGARGERPQHVRPEPALENGELQV